MNRQKISGAIGLAIRAGKCSQGAEGCEKAVRSGKAKLVLLDPAAAENTRKSVRNLCEYYHCPWVMMPEEGMLEDITGGANRKVLSVNEAGFAQMILKYCQQE